MSWNAFSRKKIEAIARAYEQEVESLCGLDVPADTICAIVADQFGCHKTTVRVIVKKFFDKTQKNL